MSKTDTEKTATILVVDDNPVNVKLIQSILSLEGYVVITAQNADECYSSLESIVPDLILLDIMLPDTDGFTICRTIKGDARFKDIPIIFISAVTDMDQILRGFEEGAVDYIIKPFFAREVIARVQTHISLKFAQDTIRDYNTHLEELLAIRTQELIRTERQAAFSQVIQGIIHNLKNPLSVMKMSVEMIENNPDSCMNMIRILNNSIEKMQNMIQSLMTKGKKENSDEIETVDINNSIQMEYELLKSISHYKGLSQFTLRLHNTPLKVRAVPSELAQIFNNLVKNAMEAMYHQGNGIITITTGKRGIFAWFSIKDNGPGIPEEIIRNIFDPFFTTKPREKTQESDEPTGTGLGLHFCNETIRSYGGKIEVHSQIGEGTEFIVYVPLIFTEL